MPPSVVLVDPEIPWNAGNIGRSCAAAGASLHLVGRLGFSISERRIKRAGMDYWERLKPTVHPDWASFESSLDKGAKLFGFSAEAPLDLWEAPLTADSVLVFGSESSGLPEALRKKLTLVRIPMPGGGRSLNVSSAAAIALYECLRRGAAVFKKAL